MKKIAGIFLATAFIPAIAFADVTIQDLLTQIQALQSLMLSLQGSAATNTNTSTTCDLPTQTLKHGSSGEAVSRLQQFLARDVSVYPEANFSGYFGLLTEKAVQRWQIKNNIITSGSAQTNGFGAVGPRTLAAMRLQWCLLSQVASSPFTPPNYPPSTVTTTSTTTATSTTIGISIPITQPPPAMPRVMFTAPTASTTVQLGNTLPISWLSQDAPSGSEVILGLETEGGRTLGIVVTDRPINGTYYWMIPKPTPTNISCSGSPITCLAQIAQTPVTCQSFCNLSIGLYKLFAQVVSNGREVARAESRVFSIGGVGLSATDLANAGTVWNFGANTPATSSYSTQLFDSNNNAIVPNAPTLTCNYSGVPYSEGITVTINCADVTVPGQSCGSFGGMSLTCKNGKWVDQSGVAQAVRGVTSGSAGGSCITPFNTQLISNGGIVPREPYFTNGVVSGAPVVPLMKCVNSVWQTCDSIGANCH